VVLINKIFTYFGFTTVPQSSTVFPQMVRPASAMATVGGSDPVKDPLKVWKNGHLVLALKEEPIRKPAKAEDTGIKFHQGIIMDQRTLSRNAQEIHAEEILPQSIALTKTGKGWRKLLGDTGSTCATNAWTRGDSLLGRHGLKLTWSNGHIVKAL